MQLAVGKTAGLVGAWTSPSLSSIPDDKHLFGSLCCARMGSATVVGLAWAAPPTQGLSCAPVLTAAAQDGSLMSWRWDGQEVQAPYCVLAFFVNMTQNWSCGILVTVKTASDARTCVTQAPATSRQLRTGSVAHEPSCAMRSCSHPGFRRLRQAARPACTRWPRESPAGHLD